MIILIAAQKGGVGKSTAAVNIATVLAQQGQTPLLFDADEQPTASEWWAGRNLSYPEHAAIGCCQQYGEIDGALEHLQALHDYIIVDAAGHDSVEMRSAMTVCDVLLMPFKPSQADLNTLPHMNDVVQKSKTVNATMRAHAFLSITPTNSRDRESSEARLAILAYPAFSLLKTVVHDRKSYRDAMAEGLGVVEITDKSPSAAKARQEMFNLVEEVVNGH